MDPMPIDAARATDEELACQSQAGSLSSFGELVERFEGKLVGFLTKRAGNEADAEDLAQEAFVRAWGRIGTYRPEHRFSTWLFTIASRLATDHYRLRGRERRARDAVAREAPRVSSGGRAAPDMSLVWSTAERVLTPEQLGALWLRYAGDMGIAEMAGVLGKTRVGVRVMLFRARERLARELTLRENEAVDGAAAGVRRSDRAGSRCRAAEGV